MTKKIKLLPMIMAIIIVVVLALCACGSSNDATTAKSTTTQTTTKQTTTKQTTTQTQTTKETTTAVVTTTTEATTVAVVQPEYLSEILARDGYDINNLGTDQLVMVVGDGTDALLYCYERDANGQWNLVKGDVPGYVGASGVSEDANENATYSPKGLFNLGLAFGTNENPGTALEYRQVTENSLWVDDPDSQYYNRWVEEGSVDQDWSSAENLNIWQYGYAVNVEYNYDDPVPGKGSAIFFHISEGPTAGCIGTSESDLVSIMQWLKPGAKMLITTK